MFNKHTFATRLKEQREEKGLNQSQLADELGVSRGSISFYENEDRLPDIEVATKMGDFFQISTDYLLGNTDVKTLNTSIQAINKYTGLSEKAIESLNFMRQDKLYYNLRILALNTLIEEDYTTRILVCICNYLFADITFPTMGIDEILKISDTDNKQIFDDTTDAFGYISKVKKQMIINVQSSDKLKNMFLLDIQERLIEIRERIENGITGDEILFKLRGEE